MSKDINELTDIWRSNEDETPIKPDSAIWKQHPEMENSTAFSMQFTSYQFAGNALISLFTAPLTTAYITMQMAAPNNSGRILNQSFMGSEKVESNLQNSSSSNLTKNRQAKIDMMIKANNASKRVFEAPILLKYNQTFNNLSSQG